MDSQLSACTDSSRWPAVVVCVGRRATVEALESGFEALASRVFDRDCPYGLVLDLRGVGSVSPDLVQTLADHIVLHRDAGGCKGVSTVFEPDSSDATESSIGRIFWARRPDFPIEIHRAMDPGIEWICGLIDPEDRRPLPEPRASGSDRDSGLWRLQAQATRKKEIAEAMLHKLDEAGISAELREVRRADSTLFVVYAGRYEDRSSALAERDQLEATGVSVLVAPDPTAE